MTSRATRCNSAREEFFSIDTRWLAFLRIAMGTLLLAYLASVTWHDRLFAFFTDGGFVPFHLLERFEPLHAAATQFRFARDVPAATMMFAVEGLLALAMMLGFGSRIAAPLAWLGLVGIHNRLALLVNAAMVTMHLVALPFCLLPLDRHVSLDALLARRRGETRQPLRVWTIAPFVLRLQLAAIYLFNGVQKSGPNWRDGSAVHYVLYSSRANWPWVSWLRQHEPTWFSPLMTYGALFIEVALALALLLPFRRVVLRRVAVVFMVLLHVGIVTIANLGPFPFVFGLAALMLLAAESPNCLPRVFGPERPLGPPDSRAEARWFSRAREALLVAHLVVAFYLGWAQNKGAVWAFGPPPHVAPLHRLSASLYVAQAWSMFAPNAPTKDRILIATVELTDGRVLDVDTGAPPVFAGLDEHVWRSDWFMQIFESRVVDARSLELEEAFCATQQRLAIARGFATASEIERVVVHELEMTRPPFGAARPWLTRSRVFREKRFLPREEPARAGP